MNYNYTESKPEIFIFTKAGIDDDYFKELFWGIEEEGIPYSQKRLEGFSSLEMASQASSTSILGVGIGIDEKSIVLHYEKLQPEDFIFSISLEAEADEKRKLGESAARLVKKIPLRCEILK